MSTNAVPAAADGSSEPGALADYWISYIDCALAHPLLPSGTHSYEANLEASPEIRDLYNCLYQLYTEESSSVNFREPVDALELGVLNYYDRVRTPLSIRTVLDNIVSGEYAQPSQVIADVALIWQNCRDYNGVDSPFTKEAMRCARVLEQLRATARDSKLAATEEVDRFMDVVEENNDPELLGRIRDHMLKEAPELLVDDEIDLTRLTVRHLRILKEVTEQYFASKRQ